MNSFVHKNKSKVLLSGLILFLGAFVSVFIITKGESASAADASLYRAENIIDEAIFTNNKSMTVTQIQQFLDNKNSVCLKNFRSLSLVDDNKDGVVQDSTTEPYGPETMSAAELIASAASIYKINPQSILVTLQKEHGLITRSDCPDWRYNTALGYGCPDTAPCDNSAFGFTRQIDFGVYHFRGYIDDSLNSVPFGTGNHDIGYNPDAACGSSVVNIKNRSTSALYSYTPYQPNAAALAAGYGEADCGAYGNRNFFLYFNDWFGSTQLPYAFKTSDDPNIYMNAGGYKLIVPQMAILQDYGISPGAVQTISRAVFDSIPSPDTSQGASSSIGHVVKSLSDNDGDGGTIYLVSRGQKYKIKSMQQLSDFGIQESEIKYISLEFIRSISGTRSLSNFVQSPYMNVFSVGSDTKRIIFDYATYISLNPSNDATPFSYYLIDRIPSGVPVANKDILVKYATGDSVRLLSDGVWYSIKTYEAYQCWGFEATLKTPVHRLTQNNYISPITSATELECLVNQNGATYALTGSSKIPIPAAYSLSSYAVNLDGLATLGGLTTRSTPLKQYVKARNSAAVWHLSEGTKRLIPTYGNFKLLKLTASSLDTVYGNSLNKIPSGGIKLADGAAVKSDTRGAVYVIHGNARYYYTHDLFVGYKNNWSSVETYSDNQLNSLYPIATTEKVSHLLYDIESSSTYIIEPRACYKLDELDMSAYKIVQEDIKASQTLTKSAFPYLDLSTCSKPSSRYIRQSNESLVYWLDNGVRHPLRTYDSMVKHNGGREPAVIPHSKDITDRIPVGNSL